jgi:hypothetical protein
LPPGASRTPTTASQAQLTRYIQEHSPGEALELLETAVQNGVEPVVRTGISADNFRALRGNRRFDALVERLRQTPPARP